MKARLIEYLDFLTVRKKAPEAAAPAAPATA